LYGADKKTSYYFALHKTFDVLHSRSWLEQLEQQIADSQEARETALNSAEVAAKALWAVLDGVEERRIKAKAASEKAMVAS
jgi:pyrroloquinoline-quinone synthase